MSSSGALSTTIAVFSSAALSSYISTSTTELIEVLTSLPAISTPALSTSSSSSCPTHSPFTWTITVTTTLTSTTYLPSFSFSSSSSTQALNSSSPSPSSSTTTLTLSLPPSQTSLFISASPLTLASTITHPSTTVPVTTTLVSSAPTGTPNPAALHCGVHGLADGDWFMGSYDMDDMLQEVTLGGCYEFCLADYNYDGSCISYEFYPADGTGAPRCNLYSASVADSLESVNPYVPNVWSDVLCGSPV
ncbi:uncharacterized protein LY89DRAFT_680959 [Mollisia scopiformis]|uniref:Apple domain-containing protein n=1 Tax=Mollisia scopiformis TaxID=149040 RepID=A0A194XRQ7_MOLSC|nr:uncharacterized protein LY89DRAFT_680959 [Mollisia scopiformis]KUJ22878.1 hypothetical protein LY89DRAFT_680959 [Mollisia scopiformis]